MPYLDSLDLANRACQHIGEPPILTIDEDSRRCTELAFAYDKLREAELRRNVWRFATRTVILRAVQSTTRLIAPNLWSARSLYLPGAIVSYENGDLWQSRTPENVNNIPGQSKAWDQYFGPMTADVWNSSTTYFSGDLVYILGANSSVVVYLSLQNGNSAEPDTTGAYGSATTYGMNDVVSYSGFQWRSLLLFNLNNTPATGPALWDAALSYGTNFLVSGSDGYIYTSVGEHNLGNDPTADGGIHWTKTGINAWSRLPAIWPSNNAWLPLLCSLQQFYFANPIGYTPNLQSPSRAIYRLPANYLREAPRDPKAGSVTVLGGPTGLAYNDWLFQGDYLLTRDTGPIMFRFVADITVVGEMDAMFCEALAARMGLAACEPVTGSSKKKADCQNEYARWVSEARTINGIEMGAEEAPEDEWVTVML